MVVYSKAKRNGKQVRKNKRKKIIKNKTEKTKQKSQSAESEKTKALFVGNLFLRLGQSKIACSLWSD